MESLSFERTTDWKLIKQIVTEPKNYRQIADDSAPKPVDWEPVKHEQIWYVLIKEKGEVRGVWCFFPENSVTWRAHMCFLPGIYGRTQRATRELIAWIWAHTTCKRIVGSVPRRNSLALRLVCAAGFQAFGIDVKSFLKDGILQDRVMLGISKP